MKFYKNTEKLPEEEKEGDYFLIKYPEEKNAELAIVTHKDKLRGV